MTQRIVNIMGEKACSLHSPNSIFHLSEVHWSSPSETEPLGLFPYLETPLDKLSYTSSKLVTGCPTAPRSCMVAKEPGDGVKTPGTGAADRTEFLHMLGMEPG